MARNLQTQTAVICSQAASEISTQGIACHIHWPLDDAGHKVSKKLCPSVDRQPELKVRLILCKSQQAKFRRGYSCLSLSSASDLCEPVSISADSCTET